MFHSSLNVCYTGGSHCDAASGKNLEQDTNAYSLKRLSRESNIFKISRYGICTLFNENTNNSKDCFEEGFSNSFRSNRCFQLQYISSQNKQKSFKTISPRPESSGTAFIFKALNQKIYRVIQVTEMFSRGKNFLKIYIKMS